MNTASVPQPIAPVGYEVAASVAFIDESFRVDAGGYYVMAAAVIDRSNIGAAREVIRGVPPRSKQYFRWSEEGRSLRDRMIAAVVALELEHVVVAATPVGNRGQGRARGLCLKKLLPELHTRGVTHLRLESRANQDAEDRRVIGGLRTGQLLPRAVGFSFGTKLEPELWIADAVAGAANAAHCDANTRYVDNFGSQLTIIEIQGG